MKINKENATMMFVAMLDNNTETVEFAAKMAWPTIKKLVIPLPG